MNVTKSILMCALLLLVFPGCEEAKENALATDGATAEDFAKYEAELAAVSGAEDHEESEEDEPSGE